MGDGFANRHFRLLALPSEIHINILVTACSDSVRDMCNSKITCKHLKNLLETPHLYKSINLMFMYEPRVFVDPQWLALKQTCYVHGNPSAILLRGMSKFMFGESPQAEIDDIKWSVDAGFDIAEYCYGVIRKIMWIDGVDNGPNSYITREFCVATRLSMEKEGGREWIECLSESFKYRWNSLDMDRLDECNCGVQIQFPGSIICDPCFWAIQGFAFCYKMRDYFPAWALLNRSMYY